MARKLSDISNTGPINSDYPNGKINDDTGSGNGTPINEAVNGDIIQYFQKLLMDAGITANNLPDNDGNNYQYITALDNRIRSKMPPLASWSNLNSPGNYDVDYRITNDGNVQLRIQLSLGYSAGTTIFTLPAGYRPNKELLFSMSSSSSIVIQTDGIVKAGANNATGEGSSYSYYEFPID